MALDKKISSLENREIPADSELPGLNTLLDPFRFRKLLNEKTDRTLGKILNSEITYIRYKPATNCLVAYEIACRKQGSDLESKILLYAKLYNDADYGNAEGKSRKTRWVPLEGMEPVIALPAEMAILYFYPNDCLIDGLRILSDPKKIQRLLYEHYRALPQDDWRISDSRLKITTIRYKPERRAVIRCDSKAINKTNGEKRPVSVFLRIYGDARGLDVFAIQNRLFRDSPDYKALSIPMPIAYVPQRRLVMMETVKGKPLLEQILSGEKGALELTAAALTDLHAHDDVQLPIRSMDSLMADALATGELLSQVSPEAAGQVAEIAGKLSGYRARFGKGRMAFVHGDFYYGQVIVQYMMAAIFDFDRSYFGEVAADIGNFCAHLRLLGIEGRLSEYAEAEESFVAAYQASSGYKIDPESMKFHLAYGLFMLSVGPFRRLEAGWKQKTGMILDECQRILQK
jgi:hypothetical protein